MQKRLLKGVGGGGAHPRRFARPGVPGIVPALVLAVWAARAPGGVLYTLTYQNSMINTVNPDTGAVLNSFAAPIPAQTFGGSGLAASAGEIFYSTIYAATIYTVSPSTGAVVNSFAGPVTGIDGLGYGSSAFGATLFAMAYGTDQIFLLNPATGAQFASFVTPFDASGGIDFNPHSGSLYVSDGSGVIRSLDVNTGAVLGVVASTGIFQTGVGFVGGRLFTSPQSTGTLTERDAATGAAINALWSPGGPVGAMAGYVPAPGVGLVLMALGAVTALRRARRA